MSTGKMRPNRTSGVPVSKAQLGKADNLNGALIQADNLHLKSSVDDSTIKTSKGSFGDEPSVSVSFICSACPCKNFEPNLWKPGLCRHCLHNHRESEKTKIKSTVPGANTNGDIFAKCVSQPILRSNADALVRHLFSLPSVENANIISMQGDTQNIVLSVTLHREFVETAHEDPVATMLKKEVELAKRELEVTRRERALNNSGEKGGEAKELEELDAMIKKKEKELATSKARKNTIRKSLGTPTAPRLNAPVTREGKSSGSIAPIKKRPPLVVPCEGYVINSMLDPKENSGFKLDYPEHDIFFYRDNFLINPATYVQLEKAAKYFELGKHGQLSLVDFHEHVNILGVSDEEKVIISLRKKPDDYGNILGLWRSKLADEPLTIPSDKKGKSTKDLCNILRKRYPALSAFKLIVVTTQAELTPKSKSINSELLELDTKMKVRNYKFGVLYIPNANKVTAEHLFDADPFGGSDAYYDFLAFLGNRIALKGWKGYRADLDVKENSTGTHSIFTNWEELEIMFHVCTLLPENTRQRMIGNDIVSIIFLDEGAWNPDLFVSQVLHSQIVVQPVTTEETVRYRVEAVCRDGVPNTYPAANPNKLWELTDDFREFLLAKLVNSERAAWHCSKKVRNQSRSLVEHYSHTRQGQLSFIIDKYQNDGKEY